VACTRSSNFHILDTIALLRVLLTLYNSLSSLKVLCLSTCHLATRDLAGGHTLCALLIYRR
jgi:hypothetical protein